MVNKRSVLLSALRPTTLLAFLQHSPSPLSVILEERCVVFFFKLNNAVVSSRMSYKMEGYIERNKSAFELYTGALVWTDVWDGSADVLTFHNYSLHQLG